MPRWVTLLGFAPAQDGPGLLKALAAIPGANVMLFQQAGIAALAQAQAGRFHLGRGAASLLALRTVQMRLEAACQLGAFLPADPAHAKCDAAKIPHLLNETAPALRAALAGPGTHHQWDVVLRWQAEDVVAARRAEIAAAAAAGRAALAEAVAAALARERTARETMLRQALQTVALGILPAGAGETETGLTVLIPRDGEPALEAALNALPAELTQKTNIDMRGPLPPLSFAAVRIDTASASDVAQAWRALQLPDQVDAMSLRRHWRDRAALLHPDRGATENGPMAAAGAAFRLIRDLLPEAAAQKWSLPALQRHAACRMRVQAEEAAQ